MNMEPSELKTYEQDGKFYAEYNSAEGTVQRIGRGDSAEEAMQQLQSMFK